MKYYKKYQNVISDFISNLGPDAPEPQAPITYNLQLSVLAGEYYSNINAKEYYAESDNEFKKCNELIYQLDQKILQLKFEKKADPAQIEWFNNQYKMVCQVNRLYERLISRAKLDFSENESFSDLSRSKHVFKYDLLDEIHKLKETEENSSGENLEIQIFKINIKLSEIDINLDCEEKTINNLVSFIEYLNDSVKGNEHIEIVKNILVDKAKLLLLKIYVKQQKKLTKGSNHWHLLNDEINTIKGEIKFFKTMTNKITEQYLDEIKLNTKDNKLINQLSFTDIHRIAKYYRIHNNLPKLTQLKGRIPNLPNNGFKSFDDFAHFSANNLINNCILRLKLNESKNENHLSFINKLDDAKSITSLIKVLELPDSEQENQKYYPDYYPFYRMAIYLDSFLDDAIENPFIIIKKELVRKVKEDGKDIKAEINKIWENKGIATRIDELIEYLNSNFQLSYNICKFKHNKPYYLSYEESFEFVESNKLINYSGQENPIFPGEHFKLFIESSYIIPDDYNYVQKKWNETFDNLSRKLKLLRTSLEVEYKVLYFEKSFKKEIENKEFKLVQALAMFIGIATLILGSMKATENRTVAESILIILGLGTTLILFNYFIYWFIRTNKKITLREIFVLALLTVSFTSIVYYTYTFSEINTNKNSEEPKNITLETKLDSLLLNKTPHIRNVDTTKRLNKL